jgi:hypothetical protein
VKQFKKIPSQYFHNTFTLQIGTAISFNSAARFDNPRAWTTRVRTNKISTEPQGNAAFGFDS